MKKMLWPVWKDLDGKNILGPQFHEISDKISKFIST